MTEKKLITIKAKDLADKPTFDEEIYMTVGGCLQSIAQMKTEIKELREELEELKKWVKNKLNNIEYHL